MSHPNNKLGGPLVLVVNHRDVRLAGVDDGHGAGRVFGLALPGGVHGDEAEDRKAPLNGQRAPGHGVPPLAAVGDGEDGAGVGGPPRFLSWRRLRRDLRVTTTPAPITSAGARKIVE